MSTVSSSNAVGAFRDRALAESAMDALYNAGFSNEQIQYFGPGTTGGFFEGLKSLFTGANPTDGDPATDLTNVGLSDEEARYYADEYHNGSSVIIVRAPGREQEAMNILHSYGAYNYLMASSARDTTHDVQQPSDYAQQGNYVTTDGETSMEDRYARPAETQESPQTTEEHPFQAAQPEVTPADRDTEQPDITPVEPVTEFHAAQPEVTPAEPIAETTARHDTEPPDVALAEPPKEYQGVQPEVTPAEPIAETTARHDTEPSDVALVEPVDVPAAQQDTEPSDVAPAEPAKEFHAAQPEVAAAQQDTGQYDETPVEYQSKLQAAQARFQTLQQQLQKAKTQLQTAREHEKQLQALHEQMQTAQEELETTQRELRETHTRIAQY